LTLVLLGLGSNQGNPLSQLLVAVQQIETVIRLDSVSAVYRTQPIGDIVQAEFFNMACRGRFHSSAPHLHARLSEIEGKMGRERVTQDGPRVIDIDLLAFGDLVLDTPELSIPHPRLHLRRFVLAPLAEIAPEWRHPVLDATVAEMLATLTQPGWVEPMGRLAPGL
jgi:2-amino-4-hydroxy-6-hydroxymethyldihydropteridine diphosphokinase